MKRHPALEPFSRDHNDGLILARRLSLAADEGQETRAGAADLFMEAWKVELKDHFDEEERLLSDLASPEDRERLLAEHRVIEDHFDALTAGDLSRFRLAEIGKALHDHIRWEERGLFVAIENSASEEQLARLAQETHEHEQRRWELNPKRKELVQRRRR
jgi:hypothetical protein